MRVVCNTVYYTGVEVMKPMSIRVDENIKAEVTAVLDGMGLTVSDACRILFNRIAEEKSFPMELLTPSPERIEAAKKRALALNKIDQAA